MPESTASVQWQSVSAEVTKLFAFIEARLEQQQARRAALSEAARVDLDAVGAAFPAMRNDWTDAESAYLSGKPVEAVKQAEQVRTEARDALRKLGIDPG
jgi:hypothetical protein